MGEQETATILGDRFRVEEHLGSGSFGNTYAAVDTVSGERVAVKELDLSHVDDWKAIDLFEREAKTLERLDHPRIPDYVDFIPLESGDTAYLAQELAPGSTLRQLVRAQGPFSEARARHVAGQMLDILVYLDSRRPPVIHRDIKPGNILADSQDDLYLVDFGSVVDAARQMTSGGSTVAGTFGYMAPEQLHGTATTASDLYGLGMTLIHLVTGKSPTELPKSRLRVQFRDAAPALSEPFARLIEKLVEPAAEDRFSGPKDALRYLRNPPREKPQPQDLSQIPDSSSLVPQTSNVPARLERAMQQPLYEQALQYEPEIPDHNKTMLITLMAVTLPTLGVPALIALMLSELPMLLILVVTGLAMACLLAVGVGGYLWLGRKHANEPLHRVVSMIVDTSGNDGVTFPIDAVIETADGTRKRFRCHHVVQQRMAAAGDVGVAYIKGQTIYDFIRIEA